MLLFRTETKDRTSNIDNKAPEVLFILTISGTLPFVFPMGMVDLMNRIDAPKRGLLAEEVTAGHVRRAKIITMAVHWFYSINEVLKLSEKFKAINPEVHIIVGGYAATLFHRQLIATGLIDYIVRGDAEKPFPDLVDRLLSGRPVDQVPNLTSKSVVNPIGYSLSEGDFARGDYRNIDWFPGIKKIISRMQHAGTVNYIYPWIPVTRGCLLECRDCLGSPGIQRKLFGRGPVLRPTQAVRQDLLHFSRRSDIQWCHFSTDFISMIGMEKAREILQDAPYQLNCYYEFYRLPTLEGMGLLSASFSSVTISFLANLEGSCVNTPPDVTSSALAKLEKLLVAAEKFKNLHLFLHVDPVLVRKSPAYARLMVRMAEVSQIHLLGIDTEEYPEIANLNDEEIDALYTRLLGKISQKLPRLKIQQLIIANCYRYAPGFLRFMFFVRHMLLKKDCKRFINRAE